METVPWRTYSNSRRVRCPGRPGWSGCLRERAVIPVFSSTLNTTALSGQVRYSAHTPAALVKNSGSAGRVSQPRTRCGLRSTLFRIRPIWEAETASPEIRRWPASSRWVHAVSAPGGAWVAAAMIRSLSSGARRGRPSGRGRSVSAARRSAAKRLRQARTVSTCRPAARAAAAFDIPSATARITLARCTCPNGAARESATCSSPRRSASVNSITNGLVSVIVPLGEQPIDPLIIPRPSPGVATG